MNGPLAAACSVVAGGASALACVLVAAGRPGEALLFGIVAFALGSELVALLDVRRLLVCALVAAYAFTSAFLLPVEPSSSSGQAMGGHAHAAVR